MPRKSQSQKQKQRQTVKQTVIVKVGETATKRKRVRRRKSPSGGGGSGQFLTQPQLPPNVIYQSNQIQAIPTQFAPESTRKITDTPKKTPTILDDTGIVGTEGKGVRILDLPTKKEQLESMTTPVALKPPKNISMGEYVENERVKPTESLPSAFSEVDVPSKFMQPPSGSFAGSAKAVDLPVTNKEIGMEIMKPTPMDLARQQEAISAQAEKMAQFDNTDKETPTKKKATRIRKPRTEDQKERDRQKAREYRARIKAGKTGRLQG